MRKIRLGCIADDFTGATDISESLFLNGLRPVQFLDLPGKDLLDAAKKRADAFVISLKIRTCPVKQAVEEARKALRFLKEGGCEQFYWKYCSTFDSTEEGNIGPVADMLLEELNAKSAIVCPTNPENGRTIYQGHLFVYDQLLENTHMANHPITPMRNSDLRKLLSPQTVHTCANVPLTTVRKGKGAIAESWEAQISSGSTYIIADSINRDDLEVWADFCRSHPLLTGGSSLAGALAANLTKYGERTIAYDADNSFLPIVDEPPLILAGSCSAATLKQIQEFEKHYTVFKLNPELLTDGGAHLDEALRFAKKRLRSGEPALIFTSSEPWEVEKIQKRHGKERIGRIVEDAMAQIAKQMKQAGVRKFVVAGGETSGAVVKLLGIKAICVGKSIAPGVPWVYELGDNPLMLALKSGNFGSEDFFLKTI